MSAIYSGYNVRLFHKDQGSANLVSTEEAKLVELGTGSFYPWLSLGNKQTLDL